MTHSLINRFLLFGVSSANVICANFDLSTEFSRLLRFLVINLVFYYRAVSGVMTTFSVFNDYLFRVMITKINRVTSRGISVND